MKQLNTHLESKLGEQVNNLLNFYVRIVTKIYHYFFQYLGEETLYGVGRIGQNMEYRRQDASAASAVAHARGDTEIRAAREKKNVTGVEARVGILQREMGVGETKEHEYRTGMEKLAS